VLAPDELDSVALAGGRGHGRPLVWRALLLPTGAKPCSLDLWGRDASMGDQSARASREDRPDPPPSPIPGRLLAAPDRGWRRARRPRTPNPERPGSARRHCRGEKRPARPARGSQPPEDFPRPPRVSAAATDTPSA
jgi:hypothetical protein